MPEGLLRRFARRLAIVLWVAAFVVVTSYLIVWYGGSKPVTSVSDGDEFPIAVARVENGRVVEEGFFFYFQLRSLKMPPYLRLLKPGYAPRALSWLDPRPADERPDQRPDPAEPPQWHATLLWATNLRGERYVEVHAVNPEADTESEAQSFYTIRGNQVVPAYLRVPWIRFFSRGPLILSLAGLTFVPYVAWLSIEAFLRRRRRPVMLPSALLAFRVVGLILAVACWAACAWPILTKAWQLPELLSGMLALAMLSGLLWLQTASPEWAVTVALAQCLGTATVFAPVAGPSPPVAFAVLWIVNTLCWFVISIWTLRRWKGAAVGPDWQEGALTAYPETLWVLYGLTAFFSLVLWPFFWGAILQHL